MERMVEENSHGYWGKPTATIDWCEANYEVTYFIAEFWNTVSNWSMIIPPLLGAIYGLKDGVERRYILAYLAITAVGTGSWLFHGTLLYQCQLLDELPMIWGSAVLIYGLKEARSPPKSTNFGLILFLTVYCAVVTAVYIIINEPVFHETAYGLMVFSMLFYCIKLVRHDKKSMYLFVIGTLFYGSGFLVWNLDNLYCGTLKSIRGEMVYPLKPFFQGHAWWHVLAGIGTHYMLLFSLSTRVKFLKLEPYICTSLGLPTSVRVRTKGH